MKNNPVIMEDYFKPGFKTKPAVHVGSQTVQLFHNNAEEQAWEGYHLAGAGSKDLVVLRNFDESYITYWNSLMGKTNIINLSNVDMGKFLTEVILENPSIINLIKSKMSPDSKLMVFLPTSLEKRLANKLKIPLHGSPKISLLYGTKSGIRKLADEVGIPMPQGFICTTFIQVKKAIKSLSKLFKTIVIKHDLSLSGYFSKKVEINDIGRIKKLLDQIAGGKFIEGRDIVVVEGWLKSKASLCAHIEVLPNQEPIICSGWQQIIDRDGISYIGAGPLQLSNKAMDSFMTETLKLANALKQKRAVGSYGPDFIVTADSETSMESDSCILVELNARVPYTAFPLEIIKQVKGKIGNGFYTQHIKLSKPVYFSEIKEILQKEKLLISEKESKARGVVPFNVGLLPWKLFDVIVMANSWKETKQIIEKVRKVFANFPS